MQLICRRRQIEWSKQDISSDTMHVYTSKNLPTDVWAWYKCGAGQTKRALNFGFGNECDSRLITANYAAPKNRCWLIYLIWTPSHSNWAERCVRHLPKMPKCKNWTFIKFKFTRRFLQVRIRSSLYARKCATAHGKMRRPQQHRQNLRRSNERKKWLIHN